MAVGCSEQASVEKQSAGYPLGTPAEAGSGSTVRLNTSEDNEVDVKVISISEYRCPADVVCVWEGNARVEFQVSGSKDTITLCLRTNESDCQTSSTIFHNGKHFALELLDVTPYPTSTNTKEEKTAKFQLREVGIENGG